MDKDDILDKQIENYIHNRMSDEERIAFEKQMEEDSVLKNEVRELITLKNDFNKDLYDFKKKLYNVQNELKQEGFFEEQVGKPFDIKAKSPLKKMWMWRAAAASVILIVGTFYFSNREPDYEQLAMNAALNDFSQLRGREDELDSLFNVGAYQAYISKAMVLLKDSISFAEKEQLTVNTASSYILLNKPKEATEFLNTIPADIKVACPVRYVNTLVAIQLKEKEKAVQQLTSFINDKCYPLDTEAKLLKKKLE